MTESLEILYEDHHFVAVNKPARIPVASEDSGDETLLERVRYWNTKRQVDGKKGYCVPIHFLDRPVSGVILFAISSKAATRLNELFRSRKMSKTYIAVLGKTPSEREGVLEHWLAKDHHDNKARITRSGSKDGKRCVLSYRVLATREGRALVEVRPETGRSHQIRAQFAAIGCPLIGDTKYGAPSGWDGKVALHALNLRFDHPVGNAPMNVIAPIPYYWKDIWQGDFPRGIDLLSFEGKTNAQ